MQLNNEIDPIIRPMDNNFSNVTVTTVAVEQTCVECQFSVLRVSTSDTDNNNNKWGGPFNAKHCRTLYVKSLATRFRIVKNVYDESIVTA